MSNKMGSQIKMKERILHAIRQVLSNDRKSVHLIPSWQDTEVLESIKSALGPLRDFTDLLSGEKHVTNRCCDATMYLTTCILHNENS